MPKTQKLLYNGQKERGTVGSRITYLATPWISTRHVLFRSTMNYCHQGFVINLASMHPNMFVTLSLSLPVHHSN